MSSRRVVLLLLLLLLAGCAPLEQLDTPERDPRFYTIRQGDTLYSIAWRHQLDWRDLAGWNGIAEPYLIHPGNRLRLFAPPGYQPPPAAPVAAGPATVTPRQEPPPPTRTAIGSGEPSPPPPERRAEPAPPAQTPAPPPPRQPTATGPLTWQWPTEGRVINLSESQRAGKKGIHIAGERGQPVRAAAPGLVVYSGGGLIGFGQLVIIKHNETYLSAYGHNERILVSEGDEVRAGQNIAQMGSSGADRVMLYFEIRRDGNPVAPLSYLPRR